MPNELVMITNDSNQIIKNNSNNNQIINNNKLNNTHFLLKWAIVNSVSCSREKLPKYSVSNHMLCVLRNLIRWFGHCTNIIKYINANLYGRAHYTTGSEPHPWLSGYNPACHDIVILWYWCIQICGWKSENMVKIQKDTKSVTLVANHGWSLQKFFLVRQWVMSEVEDLGHCCALR